MKLTVSENAGFCSGVKNAVNTALELAKKHGKIYTLGALVHNELVVDFLQSNGVFSLDEQEWDKLKCGDVALIRAHGIPVEAENVLHSRGVELYDATCPVVKRIHKIVSERVNEGDFVYIVGDKKHDEVVGTSSYAGENGKIIDNVGELEIGDKPVSIVFQTTVLANKYQEFCDFASNFEKKHGKSVGIFNTICYTTEARQNEARALARVNDAILVLGSRTSANTKRLYEAAKEVNAKTFFAETAQEALEAIKKEQIYSLSIVAGASTPPRLIQEVSLLMSEIERDAATTTAESEVKEEATLQEQPKTETPAPEKELTMEDVIASNRAVGFVSYKPGKRIKGSVLSADENGIYVSIGGKKDGFIDKSEAEIDGSYDSANYKKDDAIEAIITGATNKDYVILSKKDVDLRIAEEVEAEKALANGDFDLVITEAVKGGLRGRLGSYTVFVPASQIRMGYVKNLEEYKGKTLLVTLMPPKEKEANEVEEVESDRPARKSKYLFASARMVLEREKQAKEDEFWNKIHIHDIVQGKVKRFTAFGAFVSVDGFDCLAHISELSWNKINDPASVLTIGETYDFVVLKMDRASGKISLGYKQLQKKPYEAAAEQFPVGTVIKGKVERIFPYGAFISISEGVDGLVHVSQISHNWIKDANEILKVGEEVEAKIIGFEDNRITLSIKELLPVPEEGDAVATDDSAEDGGEKPKKTSRIKKFEEKYGEGEEKRERRPRRNAESVAEPKEWVSGNSNASLANLFGSLKLDLEEEEKQAEEPKKKPRATKAKAVVEEVEANTETEAVEKPKRAPRKKKTEETPAE